MVIFKVPALPGLFGGVILGIICAVAFQGADFGEVVTITAYDGFVSETGNEFADNLLTRGGFSGLYYSIGLVFVPCPSAVSLILPIC
jgi:NhaC family Na+:H+ antiporter